MAVLKQPTMGGSLFELPDELPPTGTFIATCLDVRDVFGVERRKYQSEELEVVDLTAFLFGYRTKEELEERTRQEPVGRYRRWLLENRQATEAELAEIEARIEHEIQEAVEFVDRSPFPDVEEAKEQVYA